MADSSRTVLVAAAVVFALLLLLPPVPPQAAIYVALVVVVLGVVLPVAYSHARETLSPLFEEESAPEPTDPLEQAKQAYVDGNISEQEFERRLEAEMGEEETDPPERERAER